MQVLPSKPTSKGAAETFTGDVWMDEIAICEEPSRLRVHKVRFPQALVRPGTTTLSARPCR